MLAGLVVAVLAGATGLLLVVLGGGDSPAGPTGASASGANLDHADAAGAFLAAASADVVVVTTYDYRRLDDARTAGLSVTTGAYRKAYQDAFATSLPATAKADRAVHDFEVLDAGIGSMSGDARQAKVLVFGRQIVTDRTHAKPEQSIVTLCVTMQREGSRYLISDLSSQGDVGAPPGNAQLAAAITTVRAAVVQRLKAGVTSVAVKSVAPTTVTVLVAAQARGAAVRYAVSVAKSNVQWAVSQLQTYPNE